MNAILTLAKKELRAAFASAVAPAFFAVFLGITFVVFFSVDKFFARGLTDVRLLFDRLPLLLIVLVAALSMRAWAEERRAGTLELLLTLPVPRVQLVAGKFLAGLALVAVALALTFGLPITVSMMGDLDWGPVFGGYLAALLLAAAYLAIGMCVSAATDNQIVAFIGTAIVCLVTWLPGTSFVADFAGGATADLLRNLGMGSRFFSVSRGVLDLRDLVYYASTVVVFLGLNVVLLGLASWSRGPRAAARRRNLVLALGLGAANALLLNVWLAPLSSARVDLTQSGEYSLSESTEKIVSSLDEPLLVRGYFSEKTHPLLAPLVPRIRDMLSEYRTLGKGKVRVEVIDPKEDDELIRDAKERFDIEPIPLSFASRAEKTVVNAYFSIAVSYGDQHQVLGLDQLITVRSLDIGDVEVSLGNLEYSITRAIKKAVTGFQSVDALFQTLPVPAKLTLYATPKTLPENWKVGPERIKKVVDELAKTSGGKLVFSQVEPEGEAKIKELYQTLGLRPYAELGSDSYYYLHLLLEVGDRKVRLVPPDDLAEAGLRSVITDGLRRGAPGFTRVVGLWTPPAPPPMPQMEGMPPQRMPPPQTFEALRAGLGNEYEVRDVDLSQRVADDVEVLVLAGPSQLDGKAAENLDQFVMRGGALVALAGSHRLAPSQSGLAIEKVDTGLAALFSAWGIKLGDELVLDEQNDAFPVPVMRNLGGGLQVRELREVPYPFFVKIGSDGLRPGTLITSGVPGAVVHWGTSVTAEPKLGEDTRKVEPLILSSTSAWLSSSLDVQPDFGRFPDTGFAKPSGARGAQTLAVAVTGGFASAFGKAPGQGAGSAAPASSGGRLLAHSPPETRVVVFGSSAFVSDDLLGLARQLGSNLAESNLALVQNAVDWVMLEPDLAMIRARSTASRVLTVAEADRKSWEVGNYVIAVVGLIVVAIVPYWRRRNIAPLTSTRS